MNVDITRKQCLDVADMIREKLMEIAADRLMETSAPKEDVYDWAAEMICAERALRAAGEDDPSAGCAGTSPCTGEASKRSGGRKKKEAAAPAPPVGGAPVENGDKNAALFKKETHARLREFREKRGLGCFKDLAERAGNGIDDITLSRMHSGERLPVELWRSVAAALDAAEKEENDVQ